MPPRDQSSDGALPHSDLAARVAALQDARVEEWLHLIRYSDTVPAAVERSLSWRITRPVRLAQTAALVLRRDGFRRFLATVLYRLRRLVTRA